jgi:hypothetical protein
VKPPAHIREHHYDGFNKLSACERANDLSLPLLDRLVEAAICHRQRNGHARFKPGELAELLVTEDRPERMSPQDLTDLIERAVVLGKLDPGSCASCLIPANMTGGVGGSPTSRCAVRKRHTEVAKRHYRVLNGEQESHAQAEVRRRATRAAKAEAERQNREEVEMQGSAGIGPLRVHPDDEAKVYRFMVELAEQRASEEARKGKAPLTIIAGGQKPSETETP